MTEQELQRLVVGDVLRCPSGDYRVIREISTGPKRGLYADKPYYFVFAIRHCSWTGRAETTKCRSEIIKWDRVGVRVKLDSELDEQFFEDLKDENRLCPVLTCCHAKAMP